MTVGGQRNAVGWADIIMLRLPDPAFTLGLMVRATTAVAKTPPWDSYAMQVDTTVGRLLAEIEPFRLRDDQLAMIRSPACQEDVALNSFHA